MSLDDDFRRLSQELSVARSNKERRDILFQNADLINRLSKAGRKRLYALAQDSGSTDED